MTATNVAFCFQWMWLLLSGAPLAAILLFQVPRTGTLVYAGTGALGSLAGIAAALGTLWGGHTPLRWTFETALPYLTLDFRLDGLSAFFLLLLSGLNFAVSIYSAGYSAHYDNRKLPALHFLTGAFVLSMAGVFTAHTLTSFFLLWESMSLLSFFLVVFEPQQKGTPQAGILYLIMTHVGSAFLLMGLLLLLDLTGNPVMDPLPHAIAPAWRALLFVLFLIGFATKGGLVPLHVWLPYAHPAAPSSVSALMSGVMIKTAVYGMLRFLFDLLGPPDLWWGGTLLTLGGLSALIGVAYAYMDRNIKRMLAYSSIENMGLITLFLGIGALGWASGHPITATLGLGAALLHTLNHALFKGSLFLGAGSIHMATHTKHMDDLGGLMTRMPRTGTLMLLGGMALASIVPMNGFIGEWLGLQALATLILQGGPALGLPALLGATAVCLAGALAAGAVVKLLSIVFLGVPRTALAAEAREVPASMWGAQAVLGVFCLFGGMFPGPFFALTQRGLESVWHAPWPLPMKTGIAVLWAPLTGGLSSTWPLGALVLGGGAMAILAWSFRKMLRQITFRRYGTWDCGFHALTPRMQYSATGFSKPMAIVLRMLFRPVRELDAAPGPSPYHPQGLRYAVRTERVFEKWLYLPVMAYGSRFSRRTRGAIQTGSIHRYLAYIFITVLALLAYARLA